MGPQPLPSLELPRHRRIKQGREFARIKTRGRRLVTGCLIANWAPLPEGSLSRIGVITGRKVGGAVIRNRARRLLRECFRLHQQRLRHPVDMVLVARPAIAGKSFANVQTAFVGALRQAGLYRSDPPAERPTTSTTQQRPPT